MQAERSRSHPGFESLPSVASSLPQQQLPTPTPPSQIQEAQTQQHTQQQIPPMTLQQQTIQQGPQLQVPVAATQQQQTQIPQSYRPQLPRFTTPPGFMPWPRMPAPFNPWAARAAPPQFQPRPPQIPAQIFPAAQADQGPQQPPQAEIQPPSRTRALGGGEEKTRLASIKRLISRRHTHSKTSTLLGRVCSALLILKPSGTSFPTCATCQTHSSHPPLCRL